jgi:hypothetical protein
MNELGLWLVLSLAAVIQFFLGYLILRRSKREPQIEEDASAYQRVRTKIIQLLGWALMGTSLLFLSLILNLII